MSIYWLGIVIVAVSCALIALRSGRPGKFSIATAFEELPVKNVEVLAHELRMRVDVIYAGMANAKPPVERPHSGYDTQKVARLLKECLGELKRSIDSFKSRYAEEMEASSSDISTKFQKVEYLHDFNQGVASRLIYFAVEGKKSKKKAA